MSLTFKNEIPYIEEQSIIELIDSIPTPFYVYSQNKIIDTYNHLKKTLNKEIYFAVKANSNQAIITLMHSLGLGADVVSIEEMHRALKAKIPPNKIIFEGVGKSRADIANAITQNIKQINIESIEELKNINSIAITLNKQQSIGLRINPDIDGNTLSKISTGRKSDKFGIDFNQLKEVCELIKTLHNISLNGLSCHIGSQIFEITVFEKTFKKVKEAINLFKSNNLNIDHLNLGGGFGVPYNDKNHELDINELRNLVDTVYPNPQFKIAFEPGRYLIAKAGFLVTKIINIKKNGTVNYLITDAGMQTLIRPALYNSYHKIIPINQSENEIIYTIAGPICESSDILAKNIKLPIQQNGNYLIICDVGAYGAVMASNYNSKLLPSEVLVNHNEYAIIRKQESIRELIKKDIIPSWLKI